MQQDTESMFQDMEPRHSRSSFLWPKQDYDDQDIKEFKKLGYSSDLLLEKESIIEHKEEFYSLMQQVSQMQADIKKQDKDIEGKSGVSQSDLSPENVTVKSRETPSDSQEKIQFRDIKIEQLTTIASQFYEAYSKQNLDNQQKKNDVNTLKNQLIESLGQNCTLEQLNQTQQMKISMQEKEINFQQKQNKDDKIKIKNLFQKQSSLMDDAISQHSNTIKVDSKYLTEDNYNIQAIENLEKRNQELEKKIEEFNAEHQEDITYNFELTAEISQLEIQHKNQINQYINSIDNFQSVIQELSFQIEKSEDKIAEINQKYEDIMVQNLDLIEQIQHLKEQKVVLSDQVDKLMQELQPKSCDITFKSILNGADTAQQRKSLFYSRICSPDISMRKNDIKNLAGESSDEKKVLFFSNIGTPQKSTERTANRLTEKRRYAGNSTGMRTILSESFDDYRSDQSHYNKYLLKANDTSMVSYTPFELCGSMLEGRTPADRSRNFNLICQNTSKEDEQKNISTELMIEFNTNKRTLDPLNCIQFEPGEKRTFRINRIVQEKTIQGEKTMDEEVAIVQANFKKKDHGKGCNYCKSQYAKDLGFMQPHCCMKNYHLECFEKCLIQYEQCPGCDTRYFEEKFSEVEVVELEDNSPQHRLPTFGIKPRKSQVDKSMNLSFHSGKNGRENSIGRMSFWFSQSVLMPQENQNCIIEELVDEEQKEDKIKTIVYVMENRLELESEENQRLKFYDDHFDLDSPVNVFL